MAEPESERWLFFHSPEEVQRWRDILSETDLKVLCVAWDPPFQDERGYWQPPRVYWKSVTDRLGRLLQVYWVDGAWYRNNLRIAFTMGGHHEVYEEIPADCIYIEPGYGEDLLDQEMTCDHHELAECAMMREDPECPYEEAHGIATREERLARREYRSISEDEEEPESHLDPLEIARATLRLRRSRR